MKYFVTVCIEETIEVDNALSENEAIKFAFQQFDPTAHDPELVEIWSDSDE